MNTLNVVQQRGLLFNGTEAALICGKTVNPGDQEGLTRPVECRSALEAVEEL